MLLTNAGAASAMTLSAMSLDERIDAFFLPVSDVVNAIVFFAVPVGGVKIPLIIVWLAAAALFFTVYLRFQPLTGFRHSWGIIRGRFTRKTDPGEVSSFQALATELSGTVGLGNIAGVALAVSLGGPGSALWIVVFGFMAMSIKMAEATLGAKYRLVHEDGTISGGPMYVLDRGLRAIGRPRTGRFFAIFYCLATIFGTFGAVALYQSNQATAIVVEVTGGAEGPFGGKLWLVGLIIAVLVGFVILGGITSIGRWASRITPLMAVLYCTAAIIIVAVNISQLPEAVRLILVGAFTGEGMAGGALGVMIVGLQRSLFSNAAGVGTASTAHAASKTTKPATEGYVAMWEPFFDSVIVCALTALVITITGQHLNTTSDGILLTAAAFGTVADWFPYVLTVCAILFAYSTLLSYSYYGQMATAYLFRESRRAERVFQVLWVVLIVAGASLSFDSMMALADSVFFLMAVPNIVGLYFLAKVVRLEILSYRQRREAGVVTPIEPPELQVGMGDHRPTPEQVEQAEQARSRKRDRLRRIRQELAQARANRRR